MVKRLLLGMSFVALVAAIVAPGYTASPVKLAEVAPVADLVAQAQEKVGVLEMAVATGDSFAAAKKDLPRDAGVLALLCQAIAEHGDKGDFKGSAADARDAAIKLAAAGSQADAKAALAAVKEAWGGKAGSASADMAWEKITKLGHIMSEVNKRTAKLRRATRKLPDDPTEAAQDASVLAVLALATHADTHEVKNKAEIADWQKLSVEMQASMSQLAKDLKAKNADDAKKTFVKAGQSCSGCHEKFRDK